MYHSKITFIVLIIFISIATYSQNPNFQLTGKVESVRKDNLLSIIFKDKPEKEDYFIIEDDTSIGKVRIIDIYTITANKAVIYKALAELSTLERGHSIRAGYPIALSKAQDETDTEYPKPLTGKNINYKEKIFTEIDGKDMLLIPVGKFIFGSNTGEKDEAPEQVIKLDDFYIDKYEVSNSDYNIFVRKSHSKPPLSWIDGKFKDSEENFPVMVTYSEAVKYADWAKKRLPTEEEWEKAARGTGLELQKTPEGYYYYNEKPFIYPWGNNFDPSKANCIEFWNLENIEKDIKSRYNKGLLPVYSFRDTGTSPFGVVNMSGNACEWTSSWYNAYLGSKYSDKMFGTQVKVIRGGAWFNLKDKLTATNREFGGLPNLYEDNTAGFRCVKDPTIIDRKY